MIKDAYKRLMARKYFEGSKAGDFFDPDSFVGNLRGVLYGVLIVYMCRYLDLWLQLVWLVCGEEHLIDVGKMQFHARIGYGFGVFFIATATILAYRVYSTRHENTLNASLDDNDAYAWLRPDTSAQANLAAEVAQYPGEGTEQTKKQGQGIEPEVASAPKRERPLRDIVKRFPVLHDLIWGWPLLLALPLIFCGKTLDGSANPGLVGIFSLPTLDFFVPAKTPVSTMNGFVFGGIAYAINHAISKANRLHLAVKLMISQGIGALAIWAWYALTVAMGAPI